MAAEDILKPPAWTCQERRALRRQLEPWPSFLVSCLVASLVSSFLGPQRRETVERAHELADRVGGDARVERRRLEFGVTQRSRVIMRTSYVIESQALLSRIVC